MDCNITDETIPATENSNGKIIYTANVIFNGETYTDVQTIIIPAINPPLLEDTEINSSEEDTTDTEVNSTEEDITDNEVNSSQENVTNTEQKESEEVIENPNTGDENKLFLWINVLAISSLVVIILLKKEKS